MYAGGQISEVDGDGVKIAPKVDGDGVGLFVVGSFVGDDAQSASSKTDGVVEGSEVIFTSAQFVHI